MNIWFYIALILIIIFSVFILFFYPKDLKRARKKGEEDFLTFLLANGFKQRVEDFKVFNRFVKPNGTVFVGDSITQEFHLSEYFPNERTYNRGIGGDTTVGLLTRLEESIFALQPKQLVLQIGTNDFTVLQLEAEATIENLKKVIERIHQQMPALPILLVSVYPLHEPTLNLGRQDPHTFRKNSRIQKINEGIKNIPNVQFVNLYDALVDNQGQLNMTLSRDGLHLNALGYQVVAKTIQPLLK